MDEGILRRLVRVDFDRMARVGRVGPRCLEPLAAYWALNQQSFAMFEFMETFEEMDSPQRNPLMDSAVGAGEEDSLEPT